MSKHTAALSPLQLVATETHVGLSSLLLSTWCVLTEDAG